MDTLEKIVWMQERAVSLHIDCNKNRRYYRSVADEILVLELDADDFGSPEVMAECIARNQLVEVRCYPSTSVGFLNAYHYDVAAAVDAVFGSAGQELSLRG